MPKRPSSSSGGLATSSTTESNEAALQLKLKELTGNVDAEASDET